MQRYFFLSLIISLAHSFRFNVPSVRNYQLREQNVAEIDYSMDSETRLSTSDIISNFFQSGAKQTTDETIITSLNNYGSESLQSMRLPRGKDEAWRFTNLAKVFTTKYYLPTTERNTIDESLLLPYLDAKKKESVLVFVDGLLHPAYNSLSVDFQQLATFSSISSSDSKSLPSSLEEELKVIYDKDVPPRKSFGSDVLTALNLASLDDAYHLHILPGSKINQPIHIIYCSTSSESADRLHSSFPKLVVSVDEDAELKLKQTYLTLPPQGGSSTSSAKEVSNFFCGNTRFLVAKNAHVHHTLLQEFSVETRAAEVISSRVCEHGSYNLCLFQSGALHHRVNLHIDLVESFANCTINGVMLSRDDHVLDLHSAVEHLAPDTKSVQNQKILLGEYGKGVFKGFIHIPTVAQRTDAAQLVLR